MRALLQDFIAAAEVDVSGREIAQALVVTAMVVVIDKGVDLLGEVTGQEIVLQEDTVFERLVPALVFATIDPLDQSLNASTALGLWMVRGSARVGEAFFGKPVGKLFRYIRRPIVGENTRPVSDFDLVEPRSLQGEVQGFLRLDGSHICTELPADNVAREIIKNGREVELAPANHLQISEVGLPHLIWPSGLILELIGRLDDDEGWARDQISGLQDAIDAGF